MAQFIKRYLEDFSWVDFVIDVLRIVIIALVIIGSTRTLLEGRITFEQWVTLPSVWH